MQAASPVKLRPVVHHILFGDVSAIEHSEAASGAELGDPASKASPEQAVGLFLVLINYLISCLTKQHADVAAFFFFFLQAGLSFDIVHTRSVETIDMTRSFFDCLPSIALQLWGSSECAPLGAYIALN